MLAVVRARFVLDCARPEWIEDELVRRGARDAHLLDEDVVSVTVEAASEVVANALVLDLLARLGATGLSICTARQGRGRTRTAPLLTARDS
jgi:hypothetical protein